MGKTNWNLILGIPGALAALASVATFVVSKDVRCSITHIVGIKSDQCSDSTTSPASNISVVKLRILKENGDALENVKVTFVGSDTIEPVYTDRDGLVESRIENEGSIKASISAKDYPTTTQILTTKIQPLVIKEIRISPNGSVSINELSPQTYNGYKIASQPTPIPTPVSITPSPIPAGNLLTNSVSLLDKSTLPLPVSSSVRTLVIKLRIIAEINATNQRATFALFDGNTGAGGCTVSYAGSTKVNGSSHTNECTVQYYVPANKQVTFSAKITPSNETVPSPDRNSPFYNVTVTNADIVSIYTK